MKMRFSPILATGARTMVPTLVLFSLFLLIVGHDLPGGGFAGGLLAAAALLVIFFAFGDRGVRRAIPTEPEVLTGIGLGLAIFGGIVGWLFADAFLAYAFMELSLPLLGKVKFTSLLLFDVGVYLLVVGLVVTGIVQLGGEQE